MLRVLSDWRTPFISTLESLKIFDEQRNQIGIATREEVHKMGHQSTKRRSFRDCKSRV